MHTYTTREWQHNNDIQSRKLTVETCKNTKQMKVSFFETRDGHFRL